MNANKSKSNILDKLAALVVILPLACFFSIVGLGGILDQRKLSKQYHEDLAQSRLPGTTAALAKGRGKK